VKTVNDRRWIDQSAYKKLDVAADILPLVRDNMICPSNSILSGNLIVEKVEDVKSKTRMDVKE
jgi:hypothetical protein